MPHGQLSPSSHAGSGWSAPSVQDILAAWDLGPHLQEDAGCMVQGASVSHWRGALRVENGGPRSRTAGIMLAHSTSHVMCLSSIKNRIPALSFLWAWSLLPPQYPSAWEAEAGRICSIAVYGPHSPPLFPGGHPSPPCWSSQGVRNVTPVPGVCVLSSLYLGQI